jgi:hypothetical protein
VEEPEAAEAVAEMETVALIIVTTAKGFTEVELMEIDVDVEVDVDVDVDAVVDVEVVVGATHVEVDVDVVVGATHWEVDVDVVVGATQVEVGVGDQVGEGEADEEGLLDPSSHHQSIVICPTDSSANLWKRPGDMSRSHHPGQDGHSSGLIRPD